MKTPVYEEVEWNYPDCTYRKITLTASKFPLYCCIMKLGQNKSNASAIIKVDTILMPEISLTVMHLPSL